MEAMGAEHLVCPVREAHVDQERRLVSTPAYMLGSTVAEVAEGIEKLVSKVLELA